MPTSWPPTGFTVRSVPTNDTTLSVAVGGDGPTLVLLHGWPQTGRAWRHVMPALARTHTVVVPDLRGTGASARPESGYDKHDQARELRGLLDRLDLPRPAVVVGHDIGAMVAFAWALEFPDDVAALVLLDALLPGLGLEEAMNVAEGGMWHFGFFMTPAVPEMLVDGHELEFVTTTFRAMSTPGTFTDDDLRTYAEAYRGRDRLRGGFAHYRTLLDDGRHNRELLADRSLPMPVLAVAAGLHQPDADPAASLRPHADDLTGAIAPTGHFIPEEAPQWLVGAIEEISTRGPHRVTRSRPDPHARADRRRGGSGLSDCGDAV